MSERAAVQLSEGTVLFEEGTTGSELFILKSGEVEIRKRVHAYDITLERLEAGSFCGELALVNDQARPVTAVAVRKTSALKVSADQFEAMVEDHPDIAVRMIKKLSLRLTEAQYRVSNLALNSSKARLLHQLRREAKMAGRRDDVSEPAPIPDDLADALALEVGEVKTHLRDLIDRELIEVDDEGRFEILDPDGVERYLSYLELDDRFGGVAE